MVFLFLWNVKYYTEVKFSEHKEKIDYQSRLLFLGSCFSENIGHWLKELRFQTTVNPYGITYNPISISDQIIHSLSESSFPEAHEVEHNTGMVHLDLHKDLNAEGYNENILQIRKGLKKELIDTSHLFLTFGTSYAFRYKETGKIINNCHKIPGSQFERILLEESVMFESLSTALNDLLVVNKDIRIFLTVSPIRHLRHGATGNQRSKSRLIRLSEMLESTFKSIHYIPIYELVMDELRDYRFYRSDDMLHLNQLGLETVKNRIMKNYIDPSAYALMDRVESWLKMKSHRVQNSDSPETQKFKEKLQAETEELNRLFRQLGSANG